MTHSTFLRFFEALISGLMGAGFLMLVLAGQISNPIRLLFVFFFLVSLNPRWLQRFPLNRRLANVLTWAYLPFFALDMLYLSRSFVPATLHLILFVQIIKTYQPRKNRDYFYLIILAFLEVLAASSLTVSPIFLFCFVLFIFIGVAALVGFEVKRGLDAWAVAESGVPLEEGAAVPAVSRFSLRQQRQVVQATLLFSLGALLLISLLGSALFFAIPRFGAGYWHRRVNATSRLSGFSDRIRLGAIGRLQLDNSVVMRLRLPEGLRLPPGTRVRGVALDEFDGRNWSKTVRGAAISLRPSASYEIRKLAPDEPVLRYEVLLEPRSSVYLFSLAGLARLRGNLPHLIYDPSDSSIRLVSQNLRRLAYEAESVVGPGPESSSNERLPPGARAGYLQLPPLDNRIIRLAQSIAANPVLPEEQAKAIESFLRRSFSYSLEASQTEVSDPLSDFLFNTKTGHCEYFASAMVVMLRSIGIPARIVNGFQQGEFNEVGEDYVIRGRDAHSWVEAYVSRGWRSFDPTPPVGNEGDRGPWLKALYNYVDAFELFWGEWVLGFDDLTQWSLFQDLQSKSSRLTDSITVSIYGAAVFAIEQAKVLFRVGGAERLAVGVAFAAAFAALLVGVLCRHLGRRKGEAAGFPGTTQVAAQIYREMLQVLKTGGKPKPDWLTATEFAASIANPQVRREVVHITEIYHRTRYGQQPLGPTEKEEVTRSLSSLKALRKRGPLH
ncbi:MAG: DUF3488 and transglutaminase-like domain-containing protein [Acidobacteriota bacterium]